MLKLQTILIVVVTLLLSLMAVGNNNASGHHQTLDPIQNPFRERHAESKEQTLKSQLIRIRHRKAHPLSVLIAKRENGFLSSRGHVVVDDQTNTLWIRDEPGMIAIIKQYLRQVDVPPRQVLIEARIINVDAQFAHTLGLRFGTMQQGQTAKAANGLNLAMPTTQAFQSGQFSLAVAKLAGDTVLDLQLSAMESEGRGKVISRPRLLTTNRESATIEAGDEIPYQEKTGEGNTSVVFKKAVLGLEVTPEINVGGNILLHIKINQDKVSSINVNGVPAIATRRVKTQVMLASGQTVVLGGIYEQTKDSRIERLPFFGNLPIIGALFRHKETRTQRRELMIFLTPRVVGRHIGT